MRRWSVPDLVKHDGRGMKEKSVTLILNIGLLILKFQFEIVNENELTQFIESKTPYKLKIVINLSLKLYQNYTKSNLS